jgi:hypothetical protein
MQNYILRLEQERDEARQEARKWRELYEAKVKGEKPAKEAVAGLCEQSWKRWEDYRKELGKRRYQTTRVAQWLAQFPKRTQAEIVTQSITKEWQGLHELRQQTRPNGDTREANFL